MKIDLLNRKVRFVTKTISVINLLILVVLILGCNGCSVSRKPTLTNDKGYSPMSKTKSADQRTETVISSQGVTDPSWKPDSQIPIIRSFMGRNVTFNINPNQPGGEDIKVVYQDTIYGISTHNKWVNNQITQISQTVLLYSKFPKEVDKDFYYNRQPMTLEFMDSAYNTIKIVDIWKERPYQKVGSKRLTYYNFDAESMAVNPYKNQNA
jgi:hypothetical protein